MNRLYINEKIKLFTVKKFFILMPFIFFLNNAYINDIVLIILSLKTKILAYYCPWNLTFPIIRDHVYEKLLRIAFLRKRCLANIYIKYLTKILKREIFTLRLKSSLPKRDWQMTLIHDSKSQNWITN